jgi:hypothetical protein
MTPCWQPLLPEPGSHNTVEEVLVPSFDTHSTFQNLQAHGFSSDQAEGITAAFVTFLDATGQTVATKADLAALRYDLTTTLAGRFTAVDTHLAAVRHDIGRLAVHLRWLMAGLGVSIALALLANITALLVLLR